MWGTSLQLIYWEKKNHMKICIENENGFQKTYAVGEKEGETVSLKVESIKKLTG